MDFKNPEVVKKETAEGRQLGFTGKQVLASLPHCFPFMISQLSYSVTASHVFFLQAIHPAQIEPIYAAFHPTEKELDLANKIIQGNEKHQKEGVGAFSIDGKMIDMPMVKWAHTILARTRTQ